MPKVDELFVPNRGRGGYLELLGEGETPLVSAANTNNGVVAFVDIEPTFKAPAITVERVGGQAYVQLLDFATVPDDISVLTPREKMSIEKIFYVAAQINLQKWRYNYGRKLTQTRLKVIDIDLSGFREGLPNEKTVQDFLPKKDECDSRKPKIKQFRSVAISALFCIHSGDYHDASILDDGNIPLISCGNTNNGLVKYCQVPFEKRYANKITIAYNGQPLTTKYHPYRFAAKDDVAVCIPRKEFRLSTLIFLQYVIDSQKWRYSYGRKCFKEKLSQFQIVVPTDENGNIDEDVIEEIVSNTSYWNYLKGVTA